MKCDEEDELRSVVQGAKCCKRIRDVTGWSHTAFEVQNPIHRGMLSDMRSTNLDMDSSSIGRDDIGKS